MRNPPPPQPTPLIGGENIGDASIPPGAPQHALGAGVEDALKTAGRPPTPRGTPPLPGKPPGAKTQRGPNTTPSAASPPTLRPIPPPPRPPPPLRTSGWPSRGVDPPRVATASPLNIIASAPLAPPRGAPAARPFPRPPLKPPEHTPHTPLVGAPRISPHTASPTPAASVLPSSGGRTRVKQPAAPALFRPRPSKSERPPPPQPP